jgi:hypothetical protein
MMAWVTENDHRKNLKRELNKTKYYQGGRRHHNFRKASGFAVLLP